MFIRLVCTAAVALVASTALATGIVTYTLESPVNGQTVTPGTTVEWTIKVSVSTGDNFGLALVTCDLVQDPNNLAKFDIPAGSAASIRPSNSRWSETPTTKPT